MSVINAGVIQDRVKVEARRAKIVGAYKSLIDLHESIGDADAVISVKKQLDAYVQKHYAAVNKSSKAKL